MFKTAFERIYMIRDTTKNTEMKVFSNTLRAKKNIKVNNESLAHDLG